MKQLLGFTLFISLTICCVGIRNRILASDQTPKDKSADTTGNESTSWYEVTNYDIRCEMVPARKSLAATALMTLTALHDNVVWVRVFLHKEFVVKSASREGHSLELTSQDSSKDRLFFSRTGVPIDISLDRPLNKGETVKVEIAYEGEISSLINDVNMISEPLSELALYSSWYPLLHDGTRFTYSLRVTLPLNFVCVTDAALVQKSEESGKAIYFFRRDHQGMDIPLLASSSLKVKRLEVQGFQATLYYKNLEDAVAGDFIRQVVDGYRLLERKVGGTVTSGRFVFVASPRGGWGYSRVPLFVVPEEYMLKILSEKDGRMESMHGSLHEMGHFWWILANSSTSDDWINESLAEFFSLYACEELFGREPVNRVLRQYADRVKSLKDPKPIVETLRIDKNGYVLYYEKGALIWEAIRERLGDDRLFGILRKYYADHKSGPPATTANLVDAFAKETNGETTSFFEEFLKTPSIPNLRLDAGTSR